MVIGTTTKPKKVPAGWVLIELGKTAEEVETPTETEVMVEVIQQPLSPMMRQMLMALGYPDAMLGAVTPEQALDIVNSGRAYIGGN